jgi:hypothetical protein
MHATCLGLSDGKAFFGAGPVTSITERGHTGVTLGDGRYRSRKSAAENPDSAKTHDIQEATQGAFDRSCRSVAIQNPAIFVALSLLGSL